MANIIKQWWYNILAFLSALTGYDFQGGQNMTTFSNSDSGDIVLGCGLHEITVNVKDKPAKVSLSIQDPCDGIPCCVGDVNKIGITLTPSGFIIYADIRTNTCCIEWECDF